MSLKTRPASRPKPDGDSVEPAASPKGQAEGKKSALDGRISTKRAQTRGATGKSRPKTPKRGAAPHKGPDFGPGLKEAVAALEPRLAPLAEKLGLEIASCKLLTVSGKSTIRLVIDKPFPSASNDQGAQSPESSQSLSSGSMAQNPPEAPRVSKGGRRQNKPGADCAMAEEGGFLAPGSAFGSAVTVDDCASMSRAVSRLLDELYPGEGPEYSLEVSSPGLDRPLATETDFERFNGALAKLVLKGVERNSRHVGRLSTAKKPWRLITKDGEVAFDVEMIKSARLAPEF